ncbi:hypothetical protein TKK_0012021 [Trichogramma kaykai]|uniref:Histone acetyltransferase type B catalytic subunit n=1 Tax=Trichogramma kaykai TaxID=54128 RepID=A0ABD2WQ34_9HYME
MDQVTAAMKQYVVNSNEALEFKLVRRSEELEDDQTTFKPAMSHQVFGDTESIFGYKNLKIKLYYSAGSLETYLGTSYSEKFDESLCADLKPDDFLPKLVNVLTPNVHENIDMFVKSLSYDETFKPAGDLVYSCSVNDNGQTRHFEVYKADMSSTKFKEYHQRLQTFVLWYIDAGNFIDSNDIQWNYLNMFERYTAEDNTIRYATVGFATIYHYWAYPELIRPRIAQLLILPPFQKKGLGSHMLRAIYAEYKNNPNVKDITVEDPSEEFQRIRDFVDCSLCMKLPSFFPENLVKGFSTDMIHDAKEQFKINKKQARRIYEILRLKSTNVNSESEFRDYRLNVKQRLNIPYKREQNDLARLREVFKTDENKPGISLPMEEERMKILERDFKALVEEYKKIIERLNLSDE